MKPDPAQTANCGSFVSRVPRYGFVATVEGRCSVITCLGIVHALRRLFSLILIVILILISMLMLIL